MEKKIQDEENVEVLVKRTIDHTGLDRTDALSILLQAFDHAMKSNFAGSGDPIEIIHIGKDGPIVTLLFKRVDDGRELKIQLERSQ